MPKPPTRAFCSRIELTCLPTLLLHNSNVHARCPYSKTPKSAYVIPVRDTASAPKKAVFLHLPSNGSLRGPPNRHFPHRYIPPQFSHPLNPRNQNTLDAIQPSVFFFWGVFSAFRPAHFRLGMLHTVTFVLASSPLGVCG